MAMWAVIVTGLPTFYLDENVQGIVGEKHCIKIAHQIVGDRFAINQIHVVKMDDEPSVIGEYDASLDPEYLRGAGIS